MRRRLAVTLLLTLLCAPARAQDAPRAAKPPPAPPPEGIRWERDFQAGLRRAASEGRPLYLCVNALLDQGEAGNRMLWAEYYPSKAVGAATRGMVCCVANGTDHKALRRPDGTESCGTYGSGTCQAHRDALTWALQRFSPDGETLVSPSHHLLDPDLREVYGVDFMQGALPPAALEGWFVRLSPRLALRSVWTERESRLAALAATKTADLGKAAAAWVGERDPYAPAALVAAIDTEADAARRAALRSALANAGPDAVPVLHDAVEAATSAPDVDPDAAIAWVAVACAVDREGLGAWAAGRVAVRAQGDLSARALETLRGEGADPASSTTALRFALNEALALRGDKAAAQALVADAATAGLPFARAARALRRARVAVPEGPEPDGRDARREAWLAATPEEMFGRSAAARDALKDPIEEVRVAAALALRRAGDGAGADILLAALADPVEGPDVRAALVQIAGADRGDDPAVWEDVVRVAPGGGK